MRIDANDGNVQHDPKIVRGLDYYTRTVFEIHVRELGARSAVCGGGRYDHLVRDLGGPDLGAVGFAVGFTPTLVAMRELGLLGELAEAGADVFVVVTTGARPDSVAASNGGMVSVDCEPSGGSSSEVNHLALPGAVASITCLPGSTGIAEPSSAGSTTAPSRRTSSPCVADASGLSVMVRRDNFCSSADAR